MPPETWAQRWRCRFQVLSTSIVVRLSSNADMSVPCCSVLEGLQNLALNLLCIDVAGLGFHL